MFNKTGDSAVRGVIDKFKKDLQTLERGIKEIQQKQEAEQKAIKQKELEFQKFKTNKLNTIRDLDITKSEGESVLENLKHILKVK